MKTRFLSLLLSVSMLLTIMPTEVLAQSAPANRTLTADAAGTAVAETEAASEAKPKPLAAKTVMVSSNARSASPSVKSMAAKSLATLAEAEPAGEPETVASGSCGDNLNWTLDSAGTLAISGTGAMTDWSSSNKAAWYANKNKIKKVIIQEGATSIGSYAFIDCGSLAEITIPEGVTSIGSYALCNCGSLAEITIPEGVTSIGSYAFKDCDAITSIIIPEGVTVIESHVFYTCDKLEDVALPAGITSIGEEAFDGCGSLTEFTIPDGVTSIGKDAFYKCSSLTEITIPDSVTSIGNYAFYECSSLTEITIPNGIKSIGSYTFYACYSLAAVDIPDSVTYIGDYAFAYCSLKSLSSLKSVTYIGASAFQNCHMTSLDLPAVISIGKSAFSSCGLKSVTLPESLTTIGYQAFQNSGLTSVSIPASVKSISQFAFYQCYSLESVTIADGVTSLDSSAFNRCTALKSITIPGSIASFGIGVFSGCSSLSSVTIADGVKTIGNEAFNGCTSLTSVEIPDSVTSIGQSAFSNCTALPSVEIPDSVTSIGQSAFYNCTSLTSVKIPDSVTSIEYCAFDGCTNLASVEIPAGVKSIGNYAFRNCKSMKSISLPASVKSIGDYAFQDCGLTSVVIPGSITSFGKYAFHNCGALESLTLQDGLKSIGEWAFYNCTSLTNVEFPDSITSIKGCAFYNCSSLRSVDIPGSVTFLGDSAFCGCSGLTSITIPDSVTVIEKRLLWGCTSLTSVEIPDSVTSVPSCMFYDCTGLTSVTIPNSVTSIEGSAFSRCSSLESVSIPDGVTSIGQYGFFGCSNLKEITIPDKVTTLGLGAFQNCTGLMSVTISNSVTDIGEYVFAACKSLTSVIIPDGVNSIERSTFSECTELTEVTIPQSVTSIGTYAFNNCKALKSITIPQSVTSIDSYAFQNCTGLTSVIIPEGVASIKAYTFSGCSGLADVAIPTSVTSIDSNAFQNCSGLTALMIPYSVASIGDYAFSGCSNLILQVVPESYAETYAIRKNLQYEYLFDESASITLTVQTAQGEELSEGYTVLWYHGTEDTPIAYGTRLKGMIPKSEYYYQVILDSGLRRRYLQPERIAVDTSNPEPVCVLTARPMVTATGRVTDADGSPLGGTALTFVYTLEGQSESLQIRADSSGAFSVTLPDGCEAKVSVSLSGYYPFAQTRTVSGSANWGDLVLTPLPLNKVTLSLSMQKAALPDKPAAVETLETGDGISLRVTNRTRNQELTEFTFQYPDLVLADGTAAAGDEISVTAEMADGSARSEETLLTLDAALSGTASVRLLQNGAVQAEPAESAETLLLVFDSEGALVSRALSYNGVAVSDALPEGSYSVVLMEKTDLLPTVERMDTLAAYDLNAGEDYILTTAEVRNGVITDLGSPEVPKLSGGKLSYTVASETGVSVSAQSVSVGRYISVRLQYAMDPRFSTSGQTLTVKLPDGMAFTESSVTLNGKTHPYTFENGVLTVMPSKDTGTVRFYCVSTEPGDYTFSASLRFMLSGDTLIQPIGSTELTVSAASLSAPERTARTTVSVSGQALAQSTIKLYDNDTLALETSANKAGTWSALLPLVNPADNSVHKIRAEITIASGVTYTSETRTVTYNASFCEVERVTMHNTAWGRVEQKTVFEFLQPDTSSHSYDYYSGYPNFTFRVEMMGEPESVQVVTADQHGDKTTVDCYYDETSGTWIGTHKYTTFSSAPVSVSVSYTQGQQSGAATAQGVPTEQTDGGGEEIALPAFSENQISLPQSYELFSLRGVSPSQGGAGTVTLEITGSGLEPNAAVVLTGGSSAVAAESIQWMNHQKIYAVFDLSSVPAGVYDLSVTCGGSGAAMSACFTVDPTLPKGSLTYSLHISEQAKTGETLSGYVSAVNTGYTDVPAPVAALSGENILFGEKDAEPESEALSVFLQSSGLAGTIAAGQTGNGIFTYQVPTNAEYNAHATDYSLLNSTIAQDGDTDTDSAGLRELRGNLIALMGDTYPEFSRSAAKMANALAPVLSEITLDTILSAYIQNIAGIGDDTASESAVDLVSAELSVSRVYVGPSGDGERAGLFGSAWISPYEIHAVYASEDGAEIIAVTDVDSVRYFTKNDAGQFVNILSDTETAARDQNGVITVRRRSGETLIFNPDGTLASDADIFGNRISLSYSGGALASVTTTDGDSVSFRYADGRIISASTSAGDTVTYTYNGALLASAGTKYGATRYAYDRDGNLTRVDYPDGTFINYTYDKYGRVSSASDGELSVAYSYGLYELTARDSMGRSTRTRYDTLGNAIWSIDTNGAVSYALYDENLQLVSLSQGLRHTVSYGYDDNGLPVTVRLPDGSTNRYSYDSLGNIAGITDAKGQTTLYQRDANGAATAIVYPDASRESFTYDANGRVATATDRAGVTRTYTYDAKGNVTGISYSGGTALAYTYDSFGNITSVAENGKTTLLSYDEKGDLTKVTYPDGKYVAYTYDGLGRRTSVTDSEGFTTGYTYNAQGLLSAVTDGTGPLVSYAWNPDGSLSRQTNANGTATAYTYGTDGSLAEIRNLDANGATLSFFRYTYDAQGMIVSMEENAGTWTYSYDMLGQLTRAVSPDGSVTKYSYDDAGNRTQVSTDGTAVRYTANELNQYTAFGDVTRAYDANGNLVSETGPDGTDTYEWDELGRLVKYTAADGGVYEYGYDVFVLRDSVTRNGETTRYLNDPTGYGFAVASYSANGSVTHYANAGGIAASRNGGETYFYHSNHLGSVTEITGAGGAVVNQYRYNQEGDVTYRTERIENPYTYVGVYGIVNDGNGLIYDRARYVSAETKSFISTDPAGQYYDLNLYRYCENALTLTNDITGYNGLKWLYKSWNFIKNKMTNGKAKILEQRMLKEKHIPQNVKSTQEQLKAAQNNKVGKNLDTGPTNNISFVEIVNDASKGGDIGTFVGMGIGAAAGAAAGGAGFLSGAIAGANMGQKVGTSLGTLYGTIKQVGPIIKAAGPVIIMSSLFASKSQASTATPKNDPSGYVYAGAVSNRVEGVTATIYYEGYPPDAFGEPDYDAGLQPLEWTEAPEYNEVNPQTSDYAGQYGWDVPQGRWRVHFEKDGYRDYWTDWMDVPPEYFDVNVNLMSTANPEVLSADLYSDEIRVTFSQYMDIDSFQSGSVYAKSGETVVPGTLEPVNAESNFEGTAASASVFRFVPDTPLSGTVSVYVQNALSYAGLPLNGVYTNQAEVRPQPRSVTATESLYVDYLGSGSVTIQVLPAEAGANAVVSVRSSSPSVLSPESDVLTLDGTGTGTLSVRGTLPGVAELRFAVNGTDLTARTQVAVVRPVDEITLPDTPSRTVAVSNGTGGGEYQSGETVRVTANDPAEGYVFRAWSGADGLTVTDGGKTSQTIVFTMPEHDVKLAALYESTAPAEPSVSVAVNGDTITFRAENLGSVNAYLIAASYSAAGQMLDQKLFDASGTDRSLTVSESAAASDETAILRGDRYAVFLVEKGTFLPLCRKWTYPENDG